jgi:hypothetical protein
MKYLQSPVHWSHSSPGLQALQLSWHIELGVVLLGVVLLGVVLALITVHVLPSQPILQRQWPST